LSDNANLTEWQTRKKLIDKAIEKRDWIVNDKKQVESEYLIDWGIDQNGNPVNDRFVDYLLFDNVGDPLAVVEAKKFSRNAYEGKQQAEEYADYIKQKFGKTCFIFLTNGDDILFWDFPNSPPRKVMGFFSQDELMKRRRQKQSLSDPRTMEISQSITDRPYQIEAIKRIAEGLSNNKRRFLLTLATGTGKTRIAMSTIDLLMRAEKVNRVLFLTDRNALRDQAMGDLGSSGFKQFFPHESKKYVMGGIIEPARLYASTLQTMIEAYKEYSPAYFDLIISDEAHRSIYGKWNDVLSYFDAIQIGLTATPAETLDKNTFRQFECYDGTPTFNFSYDDAINSTPKYLCEFRGFEARTNFQLKGIKAGDIPLSVRKKLVEDGVPLEDLNFEGNELGKKVMNKGTDEAIVREFMDESIKDLNGVLPAKTIIFAISKKHAQGLLDAFNRLYSEYDGKLAETIYSGMERPRRLIEKFMKEDMPRVAISVDMLDTGVDVPEICNLVFAKPVFSKIKFWQMVGRGTRPDASCKYRNRLPEGGKDHFLIIDHWKNLEFFNMNPEGKKEYLSEALPVRLFKTKLKKLQHFLFVDEIENADVIKSEIKTMITHLPKENISIKENKLKLKHVFEDNFWDNVAEDPVEYIKDQVAPLFKHQGNINVDEMSFELKTQQLGLAILEGDAKTLKRVKKTITNDIHSLRETLTAVKEIIDDKKKVLSKKFWEDIKYEDSEYIEKTFKPVINLKPKKSREVIELELDDIIAERRIIKKTQTTTSEFVMEYRKKFESAVKELVDDNPTLSRIMKGEDPNDEELMDLEHALYSINEDFTIDIFRKNFKQPTGSFSQFLRHILGLYDFPNFEDECSDAFDSFIKEHSDWTADQVLFVRTVKNIVSKKGQIDISDLYNAPFDRIGTPNKLFEESDVEDIMVVCKTLVTRYNVIK
jgi:type I restriction enzyme, R subunit